MVPISASAPTHLSFPPRRALPMLFCVMRWAAVLRLVCFALDTAAMGIGGALRGLAAYATLTFRAGLVGLTRRALVASGLVRLLPGVTLKTTARVVRAGVFTLRRRGSGGVYRDGTASWPRGEWRGGCTVLIALYRLKKLLNDSHTLFEPERGTGAAVADSSTLLPLLRISA